MFIEFVCYLRKLFKQIFKVPYEKDQNIYDKNFV